MLLNAVIEISISFITRVCISALSNCCIPENRTKKITGKPNPIAKFESALFVNINSIFNNVVRFFMFFTP